MSKILNRVFLKIVFLEIDHYNSEGLISCMYHCTTPDIIQSCSSHQKGALHTLSKSADPALMIMIMTTIIGIDESDLRFYYYYYIYTIVR